MRISDLGLADDDLVLIGQQWGPPEPPEPPVLTLRGVPGFTNFLKMVWGSETPNDPMLLATLLYTDADIELASYVREHFDELHQMSGPRVITYVVERPPYKSTMLEQILRWILSLTRLSYLQPKPKDNVLLAPLFWKEQLDVLTYHAWTLLGWTRSKPYDKTAAYEIARKLGIYPDQLPCLAVFDRTDQVEKIVFPVSGDFTTFFRSIFSNMQRTLSLGPGPDIWDKKKLDKERLELFNKIRESLSLVQADAEGQHIVYNFYGQTVFINRPTSSVRLQDFQNIRQD